MSNANKSANDPVTGLATGSALSPLDAGWIGHEWRARGFYSDECIHCGTIAVEGHNGLAKNHEHCTARATTKMTQKHSENGAPNPPSA